MARTERSARAPGQGSPSCRERRPTPYPSCNLSREPPDRGAIPLLASGLRDAVCCGDLPQVLDLVEVGIAEFVVSSGIGRAQRRVGILQSVLQGGGEFAHLTPSWRDADRREPKVWHLLPRRGGSLNLPSSMIVVDCPAQPGRHASIRAQPSRSPHPYAPDRHDPRIDAYLTATIRGLLLLLVLGW